MDQVFIQRAKALRGEKGEEWIKSIPSIISEYEEKWNLTVGEPFELSYNYVAPAAQSDGTQVVLKIGFPQDPEFISESTALHYFDGQAAEMLIEQDLENCVVLLEHVLPGNTLDSLQDNAMETRIACKVLKKLWKDAPVDLSLIQLETWYAGFERIPKDLGNALPMSPELVSYGEKLFRELLDTTKKLMLIHGDFHHKNILSSNRDKWLVIDPKGIIGDPIYDISVFLYNPKPEFSASEDIQKLLEERIDIFSKELNLDRARIIKWGIAQATLSALWTLEDSGTGWEDQIKVAEILRTLA